MTERTRPVKNEQGQAREQDRGAQGGAGIRAALDQVLPLVQRPARYLGLERNLVRKPWQSVPLHVALAFPDTYEIGMSHLGSQVLYHLINRRQDSLAERAYAPWPDMAEMMRRHEIPLYTLESYTAVRDFDLVGISLQSELNFINVPYLLDLAGMPCRAADRDERFPLILGGGPCTANPEPVAELFDAFLVGDAEEALDPVLDLLLRCQQEQADRPTVLRRLLRLPGVYVPSMYSWSIGQDDRPARWQALDPEAPLPVKRVWTDRLDPDDQPAHPIIPFTEVVQDRLAVEIMRGCTQGCRFCQAGIWYRPVREQDPQQLLQRVPAQIRETGHQEVALLSLSTSDYSRAEELVHQLAGQLQQQQASVSLPSLRADRFSIGLAKAVARVRKAGFTFAPEAGSDRLRQVINKRLTNQDLTTAAEAAFSAGWNLIKVYAMVGLPTETDDDLLELVELVRQLAALGRRLRGGKALVKLSVGCFVPKAFTPFQWEGMVPVEELRRRIFLLRDRLRKVKGVRLTWADAQGSALEALLARGDRSLARTILRAYQLGATLDGWSDHHRPEAWQQAMEETGIDLAAELAPRSTGATLPWDIIDAGVRKSFLRAERHRARKGQTTRDCKWGHCYHCGLPGDGKEVVLAPAGPDAVPVQLPPPAGAANRPQPRQQQPVYRRYRCTFHKRDDARFLSHRQVMDTLERALRASGAPVRFTEGFNPHIRLSMGPALATGHTGLAEVFDVDCTAPLRHHSLQAANQLLPIGLELLEARALLPAAPSLGKLVAAARYRIAPWGDQPWPEGPPSLPAELQPGLRAWQVLPEGDVQVELNLRQQDGPVLTVKQLLSGLGVAAELQPLLRITRLLLLLRPVGSKVSP